MPQPNSPARTPAARRVWVLYGLLVAASVIYCLGLFGGLDCWGRGDWDQFTFRYATGRAAMLRDGQLPLWNPYVNGGTVLIAHPHCPAFSPWYLPTLLLGAPLGLRVQVLLFVIAGAVGMAALLRRFGISPAGSFAGGVLLMMSTHFTLHVAEGHQEWCLLGLTPWVLLCLLRASADWRFVILGALLLASALLHGSVYVVAVFVPLLLLWSVLESVRTRSQRPAAACLATIGLALLLGAVVLFPRLEFVQANPRPSKRLERVSPLQLPRMLLCPNQAGLYRATRDLRNPPDAELSRLIPRLLPERKRQFETRDWHRLEVELSTTSDWTEARFKGFTYVMLRGDPEPEDRTARELNLIPPSKEGLALKDPPLQGPGSKDRATLYVRLPEHGGLRFLVLRGSDGASGLTVTRDGQSLLDVVHGETMAGDPGNTREFVIPREAILDRGGPGAKLRNVPWCQVEVTLSTTADWCDLQVVDCPYLFLVEEPDAEQRAELPSAVRPLSISGRSPDDPESFLRAILLFQRPVDGGLRMKIEQGILGSSRLVFRAPGGEVLEATCTETIEADGEKTYHCLLPGETIRKRLSPTEAPLRWKLDKAGMTYDWHEYGFYVTWLGLAAAVLGVVGSFRRQWPLYVVALLAGLIVLGAALPVSLWELRNLLPAYGSLQVPSRLLMAVVFVTAIAAGYGVDRFGRWAVPSDRTWRRRLLEGFVVAVIYVELAVLGWSVFSDIFICPPRSVPAKEQFALRYVEEDVGYAAMYSAHWPYLQANSGVLREYENIAVRRGKVQVAGTPGYRGEAYLAGASGGAKIVDWTMSRVKVDVDVASPDLLVLNQNYFTGWKAIRVGRDGRAANLAAEPTDGGLISVSVAPGDREVEFYYLPDSFLIGSAVSGLALLGCLIGLLAGGTRRWRSWRVTSWCATVARLVGVALRSKTFAWAAAAAVLNAPLLLCHPARPLIDAPLIRSLAVGAVLLLVPGLPLVGAMAGRGWRPRLKLLWAVLGSLLVLLIALAVSRLIGMSDTPAAAWNVTWIGVNLALLLNLLSGGSPTCGIDLTDRKVWIGVALFAVSYPVFFHGAARIVPVMEDHDYEIQGTARSLLGSGEMKLLTDRHTRYCYAHPPLAHVYTAGSFSYFDQLGELAGFEEAWDRVQKAEQGVEFEPVVEEFYSLDHPVRMVRRVPPDTKGATRHRILEVDGMGYRLDSQLPDTSTWLTVEELEVQILYDDFRNSPQRRLATRTPGVFLAALTVALLGMLVARLTGEVWLALLVPAVYATGPEVFVRSAYGGYFAISMFALVQILLAVEERVKADCPAAWRDCLLAGTFAAVANHKLVFLPIAVVVWEILRLAPAWNEKKAVRALFSPVAVGFAAGTLLFWAYGLATQPGAFWVEHVRGHLVDRVIHHNPLSYTGYPGWVGLWFEFWQHTGYLLLPLGIVALVFLCIARPAGDEEPSTVGWRGTAGLWAVWMLLVAVAFTLVDWRQTKHLMPLLLPLHLSLARWAATSRKLLIVVGLLLLCLLAWNLDSLQALAAWFEGFTVTPAW